MPTTQYTIYATLNGKEISTVVFTNSVKNYWVEFFKFTGYTNIRVEEMELTY